MPRVILLDCLAFIPRSALTQLIRDWQFYNMLEWRSLTPTDTLWVVKSDRAFSV